MKGTSVVSFLMITLLLAGAVCIQGQEPVKDTKGDTVQIGEQYDIMLVNTDGFNGNGLIPFPSSLDPICPFGIFQGLYPLGQGMPVSFAFPYSTPETIVKTYYDVTIEFQYEDPLCTEFSRLWKVNETSSSLIEPAIVMGGKPERANSWFQIKDAGEGEARNTYKLTTLFGTVGFIPGPLIGVPQLVLTNGTASPVLVRFKKVDDPTTATTYTSEVKKLLLRRFPMNEVKIM